MKQFNIQTLEHNVNQTLRRGWQSAHLHFMNFNSQISSCNINVEESIVALHTA